MSEAVQETLCTECQHRVYCKYLESMMKIHEDTNVIREQCASSRLPFEIEIACAHRSAVSGLLRRGEVK